MYSRFSRSKQADLRLFACEGADEAHAGVVFLRLRGDIGEAGLDALEACVDAAAEVLHQDAGERHGRQRHQREIGTDAQQEEQREDGKKERVGAVHQARTEQHAHGVQVVGHARHQVAGAIALIEVCILLFQLSEEIVAQIELDIARDADQHPALSVEKNPFDERDGDQQQSQKKDVLARGAVLERVDGAAKYARKLDPDGIGADAGQRAPHVSPAVTAHVGEKRGQVAQHGFIVREAEFPGPDSCSPTLSLENAKGWGTENFADRSGERSSWDQVGVRNSR